MLPFRICQRKRRSNNCSLDHVKKKNIIIIQTYFFLFECYNSYIVPFADIHYFHCLRIIEILKGTEVSTKNIFGRYSSQRMKVMMHLSAVYYYFNV